MSVARNAPLPTPVCQALRDSIHGEDLQDAVLPVGAREEPRRHLAPGVSCGSLSMGSMSARSVRQDLNYSPWKYSWISGLPEKKQATSGNQTELSI
jgi:hypothetical protein